MDLITEKDLLKMKDEIESAKESTIPFPIVQDENVAVVGDANKTEIVKHDFTIDFIIPAGNGFKQASAKYEDVYLQPRYAITVQRLMTALMPLFYKVDQDGNVTDYTDEEMKEMAKTLDMEVYDQLYRLVGVVVGVDESLWNWMAPYSVLDAFFDILRTYPDMVSASEAFFELLSGNRRKNP